MGLDFSGKVAEHRADEDANVHGMGQTFSGLEQHEISVTIPNIGSRGPENFFLNETNAGSDCPGMTR